LNNLDAMLTRNPTDYPQNITITILKPQQLLMLFRN